MEHTVHFADGTYVAILPILRVRWARTSFCITQRRQRRIQPLIFQCYNGLMVTPVIRVVPDIVYSRFLNAANPPDLGTVMQLHTSQA